MISIPSGFSALARDIKQRTIIFYMKKSTTRRNSVPPEIRLSLEVSQKVFVASFRCGFKVQELTIPGIILFGAFSLFLRCCPWPGQVRLVLWYQFDEFAEACSHTWPEERADLDETVSGKYETVGTKEVTWCSNKSTRKKSTLDIGS